MEGRFVLTSFSLEAKSRHGTESKNQLFAVKEKLYILFNPPITCKILYQGTSCLN